MAVNSTILVLPPPYIWDKDEYPCYKNPVDGTIALPPHYFYDGVISSGTSEAAAATADPSPAPAGQPSDEALGPQKKSRQTPRAREGVKQKKSDDWYKKTFHWWKIFEPNVPLAFHSMTPSTLELWRKYFTGAFGARFRKYMKDAYNEEVMRCFNESGTGLTLNNQVPQNVKELEALYCCSEFQEMVRSGNEGRTIVFQHGWDWFRALAHGENKRWVEVAVNNYLKDELKVPNVQLADGVSSTVSTKEHSLLRVALKVSRNTGKLVEKERTFFKCHFVQQKVVSGESPGMDIVSIDRAPRKEYYVQYQNDFQHSGAVGSSMNGVQAILRLARKMNENTLRILITSLGALLPHPSGGALLTGASVRDATAAAIMAGSMGVNEQTSGEDLMNYINPLGTPPPMDDTTPVLPNKSLPAGSVDSPLQMPPSPVQHDEAPPAGNSADSPQLQPSPSRVTLPGGAGNPQSRMPPSPPARHNETPLGGPHNSTGQSGSQGSGGVNPPVQQKTGVTSPVQQQTEQQSVHWNKKSPDSDKSNLKEQMIRRRNSKRKVDDIDEDTPCCSFPSALGGFGVFLCPNEDCSFAICRPCHGKVSIGGEPLNDTGKSGCDHNSLTNPEETKSYFKADYYKTHPNQARSCSQCRRWITKDSKALSTGAPSRKTESKGKKSKV